MLHLRVFAPVDRVEDLEQCLLGHDGVRYVARGGTAGVGETEHLLTAYLVEEVADGVLDALGAQGVPPGSIFIVRLESVEPDSVHTRQWLGAADAPPMWAEIVAGARSNARLFGRYAIAMIAAGIIAAFGVIDGNEILIVGAMAVSPDLLPLVAACVGIVGGRPLLIARGVATLLIGLLLAATAAWLMTGLLQLTNDIGANFEPAESGIGTLADTDVTTVAVALTAGVVGMLAFQTRASSAVGVAISVTTIPAAAYLGVVFAIDNGHKARGALGVLGTNLLCLLVAGSATLAVQRVLWRHAGARRGANAVRSADLA